MFIFLIKHVVTLLICVVKSETPLGMWTLDDTLSVTTLLFFYLCRHFCKLSFALFQYTLSRCLIKGLPRLRNVGLVCLQSYLGQHNHMKFSGSPFGEINSMSPRSGPGGPHSPLYSQSVSNNLNSSHSSDLQKLQSDVLVYKTKLDHWEQAYNQAKAVSRDLANSL